MNRKKIVAVVGTYRSGRTIDTAVEELLSAARQEGVDTETISLLDKKIEFCTNCRTCTQIPGDKRGDCPIQDDMGEILTTLEEADGLVLASPVNFGNVTGLMKRFIERLVCYAYWPWDCSCGPKHRIKKAFKPAVLITSTACPAIIGRRLTAANPLKTMKMAARCLGAKPAGTLYFGLMGVDKEQTLGEKDRLKSRRRGIRLARAI